jgi:hypothetical protein
MLTTTKWSSEGKPERHETWGVSTMGRLDIDDRPQTWNWDDEGEDNHVAQESLCWSADHEDGYEPLIMRGFD